MSDVSDASTPLGSEADASAPADFSAFPISSEVREALASMGYTKPTIVQEAVIRPALEGRDLLVQSKTGSGKTSAFGIPLIERLVAGAATPGRPQALILLPTRELAHQVAAELSLLAKAKGTKILSVYGGVPMGKQVQSLAAGVDIVVGTPGRLLDHVRRQNLNLDAAKMVVLDEADEMLSMGFWDDVVDLLKNTPKNRQTLLFSATLPYEVAKSAAQFSKDPVRLDVSGDDLNVVGIDNTILHVLPNLPKPRQLLYALEGAKPDSAIIFCNTRNETELLAKYLTQSGFMAEPLSGNFKQKERDRTMARIKGGELRYMVATDIAARGIDIADLSHVFNYSLPEFSEVYLHRVGRTGRAGKLGKAISLVDGKGLGTLSVLEREFGVQFTEMALPPEDEVINARSQRIMKELAEKAAMAELGQHLPVAKEILTNTAEGANMVAFLLKAYFNGLADAGRRMSVSAEVHEPDADDGEQAQPSRPRRARTPRRAASASAPAAIEKEIPIMGAAEALSGISQGPQQDVDDDADDEGGRKRRRRRRGRGRGTAGGPGSTADAQPAESMGFEIVDAKDVLRGLMGPSTTQPMRPSAGASTAPASRARPAATPPPPLAAAPVKVEKLEAPKDGLTRIRVNIGFDDGFKGRGAVAKKISALAGLNDGIIVEEESRRDHAVLKATPDVAEMVRDRVDGAQLGKKVITVQLSGEG